MNDPGQKTIHFIIPDDWTDAQAAVYILNQLADHPDAYRLVGPLAADNPKLFGELRDVRFRNGLATVATLAKSYYVALAGLAPVGMPRRSPGIFKMAITSARRWRSVHAPSG